MCFGHSRGEFAVPRNPKWETPLFRLFEAIVLEADDFVLSYGVNYENNIFSLFRYHWGGCTCGWESIGNRHQKIRELYHCSDCYQHEYAKIRWPGENNSNAKVVGHN